MKKEIKIIINKSEITAGTRGASLGPEAIMTVARKQGKNFFGNHPIEVVEDSNYMLDQDVKYPNAKRIEGLFNVFESVSSKVEETLNEGSFPLVIAGDHGSAGGTIAGIKAQSPTKRLGVIWIDAHGDLHTPYTTPSGNMHGMPLATALGEDNMPSKRNDPSSVTKDYWNRLKEIRGIQPKIAPEDLVFIAVRDTEPEEESLMDRLNITNHTVESVRSEGVKAILNKCLDQLSDCDHIYVSFDVDSMDPEYTSHGTGTPVDNGLLPKEAEFFLCELAKLDKTICIEFVEVNPCLDEKINRMAEVTFDLMEKTVESLESK